MINIWYRSYYLLCAGAYNTYQSGHQFDINYFEFLHSNLYDYKKLKSKKKL